HTLDRCRSLFNRATPRYIRWSDKGRHTTVVSWILIPLVRWCCSWIEYARKNSRRWFDDIGEIVYGFRKKKDVLKALWDRSVRVTATIRKQH
uniref:Uncharacterized protein n=1 Tax=Anopheles atroparvus TaxID=41427 RepID=A0AAG5CYJ7_ANOAO